MTTTSLLVASLAMLLAGSIAYADDADGRVTTLNQVADGLESLDHRMDAPTNTVAIGIAAGYAQGLGPIGGGMPRLDDMSKVGGAVELDAMYRIDPTFAVGAYGSLSRFATMNDQGNVFGATAGIEVAAHLRPERSVDPWLSLGAGWRGLWRSPESGRNTSLRGLELARLRLGVDYRINDNIAIAPVIGGSLNVFVTQDSPMTTGYTEIADKKVNFIGFAGLAGRFDL